ncbi:hypothetical protein [Streptomyces sp. 4R-3d]|uniref:hypothetical protein n=1 Tax=Streptomyces sp. 4R-3d TaxID=2559605 RepID=UPI0010723C33|nr:hypothetical protein [Streptomyces sp. 4R-3d]TFI30141.1 hypothetical protein E4P36_05165 [Streptomyces sp. 4R-3d]
MIKNLFKRRTVPQSSDPGDPVDIEVARQAAALVNAGDADGASALCARTANPHGTAFAAFRWIDTEEN